MFLISKLKIDCTASTYIKRIEPYKNFYSKNSLLVGTEKKDFRHYDINVSILTFSNLNISKDKIIHASLLIYLKTAELRKPASSKIRLLGNSDPLDLSHINYSNLQINGFHEECIVEINNLKDSYAKMDITPIIKKLAEHNENYNIFLMPCNNHDSFFEFNTDNDNKPYLSISLIENQYEIESF